MNRTRIEWTNQTWNPITGCLNNCSYCYAKKLANGRLKKMYLSNKKFVYGNPLNPFNPRFWPERLLEPYDIKKPQRIFTCSMGEMFGVWVPADWIVETLKIMWRSNHTYQILTKEAYRAKYFNFPSNVWLGVTIESKDSLYRIDSLKKTNAEIKFISFEPLLSEMTNSFYGQLSDQLQGINWIIIGAQTNPSSPPKKKWILPLMLCADLLDIPVFLKNNLKPIMGENLRQEFPKCET